MHRKSHINDGIRISGSTISRARVSLKLLQIFSIAAGVSYGAKYAEKHPDKTQENNKSKENNAR